MTFAASNAQESSFHLLTITSYTLSLHLPHQSQQRRESPTTAVHCSLVSELSARREVCFPSSRRRPLPLRQPTNPLLHPPFLPLSLRRLGCRSFVSPLLLDCSVWSRPAAAHSAASICCCHPQQHHPAAPDRQRHSLKSTLRALNTKLRHRARYDRPMPPCHHWTPEMGD